MQAAANPTQYFFYTPEMSLLSQTELRAAGGQPQIAVDYIWFNGHPVAEERPTQTRYTYTDHLGTPFLQTDTSFAPVWRIEYEPFGGAYELRTGTNPDQRLRFPGQEYDEQTPEREYNIFRWYRSGWGRYTQADPLATDAFTSTGERGRAVRSPYSYVEDNPLTRIDPLGLASCEGSCGEDCPGGKWAYIDANAGFAVLFGKSIGAVTYVCLSAKKVCTFAYKCTTVGLQAYAGGSVTWGAVSGCKCGSDLANVGTLNLSLIPGQFGPVINNGCVGGGIQASKNLGYQAVVGSLCSITKKLVCQ